MLGNHALVFIWAGKDCPEEIIQNAVDLLVVNGIALPELVKVTYKDQEGIADSLIKDISGNIAFAVDIDAETASIEDTIKSAVMYIGGLYEDSLKNAKGNYLPFAVKLLQDVTNAKKLLTFNILDPENKDRKLWRAVEIIATVDGVIPASLAKKYHFNKSVVSAIKSIYSQLQ